MFCMAQDGHFNRLRSVIDGLARRGMAVHVYTDSRFAPEVGRLGGIFHDMLGRYPLELADGESFPRPCRFVTYAAVFGRDLARDVAALQPAVVIHDSFAVIGRVVADLLGVPRINVYAGHDMLPERVVAEMRQDPRVRISEQCGRAVGELQTSFGIADASPFLYVSARSAFMNLYCEPPVFLPEDDRQRMAPVAFIGSLPPFGIDDARRDRDLRRSPVHVYISFGTVVWFYHRAEALAAMTTVAAAFSEMPDARARIGLGNADVSRAEVSALTRPRVQVEHHVDQWQALRDADLFVTHHGLNSTHEAIYHRVPMLSYPFFSDQPALAATCQRLGLALPLAQELRAPLTVADVHAAFERAVETQDAMQAALDRARGWELETIAGREAIWQWIEEAVR